MRYGSARHDVHLLQVLLQCLHLALKPPPPKTHTLSTHPHPILPSRLTVLLLRPIALAFQAEKVPEGSVWYSAGEPSGLKPTIRVEMPNGRTPPLWREGRGSRGGRQTK